MTKHSSRTLAERFALKLPPDVVAWFDERLWEECELDAYSLSDILATAGGGSVWAGQMPPDTLPLWGDGCGDRACLRFSETGGVREIIWWSHEGGGWRSLGDSLAESLLYLAAQEADTTASSPEWADRMLQWTALGSEILFQDRFVGSVGPAVLNLLDAGLAEVAIRHDLCEAACADEPDWGLAAEYAGVVARRRPDLAWPFAVLGRAAEARGDVPVAVQNYRNGLLQSKQTLGFTRRWHKRGPWSHLSFASERLEALGAVCTLDAFERRYSQALREYRAYEFWTGEAERAETDGAHDRAYWCYWNAGWDAFTTNDAALLDHLAHTAQAAGFEALFRVAEHHRRSFRDDR